MIYAKPNTEGSLVHFVPRCGNFIGGEWVNPVKEGYFEDISPINGEPFCEVPRSTAEDIEWAVEAAHQAREGWGKTSPTERAAILNKIADRLEANREKLAVAESWETGKPIRETLAADIPMAIDHYRYFAGCLRAQEGGLSQIDQYTVAHHFHEPLGVVGQIIPWNFPITLFAWKTAPALAAGNCIVIKPAEQTPVSALVLMELIQDLLPPGVLNIVNGFGLEAGRPLAMNKRIAKIAFTGETTTGKLILEYAADNIIPVTVELGGKSPNIFFADVLRERDSFIDKALEGFTMFAMNQGEMCTCPSRAIIDEKIYDEFIAKGIEKAKNIKQGNPLDTETMLGALASKDQLEKVLSYMTIGKKEGVKFLLGGEQVKMSGEMSGGYYFEPTILKGHNNMRVFREEIFGPVVSVTTFKTEAEALSIANDSIYGLGAGVWTRDINTAFRMAQGIQAGRIWTNCYHLYPAHAAFGGYKKSGFGRETHKMTLDHYQQTKSVVVSYDPKPMGFF